MKIILASASPRRKELLANIVDDFEIKVSDFDEDSVRFESDLGEYVEKIALGKAQNVLDTHTDCIVIGSDTIVVVDNQILGKPKDEKDAKKMLRKLSGSSHEVYSAVAIITKDEMIVEHECTKVTFSELTDEEIIKYIKSGEPMDKAGAYGIQGKGGVFVEKIEGCYHSVVGLPINRVYRGLKDLEEKGLI